MQSIVRRMSSGGFGVEEIQIGFMFLLSRPKLKALQAKAAASVASACACQDNSRVVGGMSKMVVARYQDGRVIKGTSMDVDPNRTLFHVRSVDGKAFEGDMNDLKALFFVRSLEGDAAREEALVPIENDPRSRGATFVKLVFADGEKIVSMTIAYPPRKPFFFVNAVDPGSNNIRILVNRNAVTQVERSG